MSSSKGSTTSSSFKPPAEFMEAYQKSLKMAQQAVNTPYQQYSGDLVAGLSPSQLQGLANINAAQGIALPGIQKGMEYSQQAAQGITPELYQQFYSPYVRDVADTTFANLMESQAQQQSNLKSGAIQSGAFGGDRGGVAQAELARQQQLGNAQGMANIYNQGYGQAMGLAGQQVANLGSMGNQIANLAMLGQGSILQGAQAQMAAGAQQQATEQARLQAAYDQWTQFMAQPYQNAQFYANIAQGLGAGAGGTSSTTAPAPNLMSQIFGGIGAIGSIYSDERVKENIEPIGKLKDGQTVYRYNYKGDPKTQIGLIAQEVEERNPGAVTRDRSGIKMVDYGDATDDAAQMSSMGGVVGPDGGRQFLAEGGGLAFYPYGYAQGYIPEGKIGAGGDTIGYRAPKPFEDEGLAKDWADIMPITEGQAAGIRKLGEDVGILDVKPSPPPKSKKSEEDDDSTFDFVKYPISVSSSVLGNSTIGAASGGVVGRGGYADGGDAEYPELIQSESGGDFGAQNEQGYVGRAQFGPARLIDVKRAGVIPPEMTPEQFRADKNAQVSAEKWHFGDINSFIDKSGLGRLEGKSINGVPITREGLVNVAHLGGKEGLKKFVTSGGRYNPADDNGTRLSDYLAMAADKSGVASSDVVPAAETRSGVAAAEEAPRSRFNMSKLFASEDNPSVIERIMGKRLSPEARSAVMNASFALMAGRSPFFFTNIGEAGKVGTQTYYNALAQKRATEKMRADIARQGFEAQTQRMGTAGQLAGIVSPIYKALTMWQGDPANAGKPLPDWIKYQLNYLRQIGIDPSTLGLVDTSSASGAPAGTVPPVQSAAAVPGSVAPSPTPIPPPSSTDLPSADGAEAVSPGGQPVPPAAPAATPAAVQNNPEAANFFDQTLGENNYTNPFYHLRMAGTLRSQGLYEEANKSLAEGNRLLTEIAKNKTITTPQGDVVNVPSALTASAEATRNTLAADAYQKSVNQIFEEDYRAPLRTYGQTYQALSNAANVLRGFETGSLTELKSNIAGVMDALGVPVSQDQLDAASDNQKFTKLIIGNLLNSGLKQNLGNVALGELQIAMRGTASSENQPSANRSILGVSLGVLNWQRDRARAIGKYIQENGGAEKVDPINLQDFVSSWDEKIPEYTEEALANTPVKGEINFGDPASRKKAKVGWKYVMPDNAIAIFDGTNFVGEE